MPNTSRELTLNHQHSYTHGSSISESLQGLRRHEGQEHRIFTYIHVHKTHTYMYIHIHVCTRIYIYGTVSNKIAPQNSLAFESL